MKRIFKSSVMIAATLFVAQSAVAETPCLKSGSFFNFDGLKNVGQNSSVELPMLFATEPADGDVVAEVVKEVVLPEAGTLADFITEEEVCTITSLKVTGQINGTDIKLIRKMAHSDENGYATDGVLKKLDLSEAQIVAGGDYYVLNIFGDQSQLFTQDNVVGPYMFGGCPTLEEITLPGNITEIGDNAFNSDPIREIVIPETVTRIGGSAFYSCQKLESVVIPDAVVEVGDYAFGCCTAMTYAEIGDGVDSVGISCFFMNQAVTVLKLGKNFKEFKNDYVFAGMYGLKEVIIDEENPYLCTIDRNVYSANKENLLMWLPTYEGVVNIPEGVQTIGSGAFGYCKFITDVVMPSTMKIIGPSAFGTSSVAQLTLNEGLEEIGKGAFSWCGSVKGIELPSTMRILSDSAFDSSVLPSVVINEGLDSIGARAFAYTPIQEIIIPSSTTKIGDLAFWQCYELWWIDVNDENKKFADVDGVLFDKDITTLIVFPGDRTEEYVVPEGVKEIKSASFQYYPISAIVFPESLETIGDYAFNMCSNLTSIELPDNVKRIGMGSFVSCPMLETIKIGKGIEYIGDFALAWNTAVKNIYCSALTPPELGSGIFGGYDFEKCNLWVPEESVDDYKNAEQWCDFINISQISGVGNVNVNSTAVEVARYDASGMRVDSNAKGLVMIKYSDGTVVKTIIR